MWLCGTKQPERQKQKQTSITTVHIRGEDPPVKSDQCSFSETAGTLESALLQGIGRKTTQACGGCQRLGGQTDKDGHHPLLNSGSLRPRKPKAQTIQLKTREGEHKLLGNTEWKKCILFDSQTTMSATNYTVGLTNALDMNSRRLGGLGG